jgi:uncharacterized protein (TIGR03437 family)
MMGLYRRATFSMGIVTALWGQVTLNQSPSRVLGHPGLPLQTANANWVEGRELNDPRGVALDESASPPVLYVSDTGNNRVLVWRNANSFGSGTAADLVIGQRDRFSTFPLGPGTSVSVGLTQPTGLAVRNGDLYVVDTGNNRILRFPNPLAQTEITPDLVIGQLNFSSRAAGLSERGLNFAQLSGSLAFDSTGNLYVADIGNRRVLRFPSNVLGPGARSGPAADLVIGQPDFISNAPVQNTPQNQLIRDRFIVPVAVAVDGVGRLYVSDYDPSRIPPRLGDFHRVLVFAPPLRTGMAATRIAGVNTQANPTQEVIERSLMVVPRGITLIGNEIAVADSASHRILIFPRFEDWPDERQTFSPLAKTVIGQANFSGRQRNRGSAEPAADRLYEPVAMAYGGSDLFVVDASNHRVLAFSPPFAAAGRVLGQTNFSFNSANLIEGREFSLTVQVGSTTAGGGVAIDQRGTTPYLYVADTGNHRVLGFRDVRKVKAGDRADVVIGQPDLQRSLCNYPSNNADTPNETGLCFPIGLTLDEEGNLYVADGGNGRVLRFPKPFTQTGLPRADLVLGQSGFAAVKLTDPGVRTMAFPYGLAWSRAGLLVSDAAHNRVLLFAPGPSGFSNGMAASKVFGQPDFFSSASGSLDNRLDTPLHIAVDSEERLYVADSGNQRIPIYARVSAAAADPRPVVTLTLSAGASLGVPSAVFVNPDGSFWVSERSANRVVRFPRFDDLAQRGFQPNAVVSALNPLAITQDTSGAFYVADSAHRIAVHFPALAAINGASFVAGRALAPGVIASVFAQGYQFAGETRVFNELPNPLPMPRSLLDTEIQIQGLTAPLFFVSPGQINFLMPMNAPVSGAAELLVVRSSTGQVLGAGTVQMNEASPALFTTTSTGSGQVAAINEDGTVNAGTNPASRGTVIALYGTGQGALAGAPLDGEPAQGLIQTPEKPRVLINNVPIPEEDVLFSGLAPTFVGVWQINVRIPATQNPGSTIPISIQWKGIPSNNPQNPAQARTTIAVKL